MKCSPVLHILALLLPVLAFSPDAAAQVAEPLPLIPETLAPAEKMPERTTGEPDASRKKSKTETAADDLKQRIRFREVKTRALSDPQVRDEWQRAEAARTDAGKREALRRFYERLYARMLRLDGSLKSRIAAAERSSLAMLRQSRIDPSETIEAPGTRPADFSRTARQ